MARSTYTPLPKLKKNDGTKSFEYDFDAIKELYIRGPDYAFPAFLRANNFHPDSYSNLFRHKKRLLSEWKLEWKRHQITMYDEELTPDLMSTTRLVTVQRIKFVKDWTKRVQFIKQIFDMKLAAQVEDYNYNVRNREAITAGALPQRDLISMDDMTAVSNIALKIQELEMRSLLVVSDPEKLKKLEDEAEEIDDTKEIEIAQLGKTMSGAETVQLMASYFDQFKENVPANKPIMIESSEVHAEED